MYNKLPVKERIELMKSYRKANKDMSYRDMVNDYNTSYQKFDGGGIKEDDEFDFSKTQQKAGPRVEEDLYSGLYNTVETPKNLSELPSYRAYTYGANQYYAPISHPQKGLKDVLAWDEKTGMNYQLNEKNYKPFKEIPMTGNKSANLRRFVMDVAGTKDTQTYDLNLNKEGKYIKPNTSESGRITDPSEIKQNVFKDLYAQNLYKYKGDKDIAFGATRDFVEKRVEPLLGEYHKFKYDPKHPEHYMALGAYGDTDLDVTRLVSNFVDAPMQNYFKNNNNVTQEDVNKIIKGEDVAKSIEEYRPALRDYFKVAKNLSSKDTDELINKSFNEYYQSQQPQKQRYGGIQKFGDGGRKKYNL